MRRFASCVGRSYGDRPGTDPYQVASTVGAARLGIRNLADAEEMERSGASALDVWRATGWWKGGDGKWRVEISDPNFAKNKALKGSAEQRFNECSNMGGEVEAREVEARMGLTPDQKKEIPPWVTEAVVRQDSYRTGRSDYSYEAERAMMERMAADGTLENPTAVQADSTVCYFGGFRVFLRWRSKIFPPKRARRRNLMT